MNMNGINDCSPDYSRKHLFGYGRYTPSWMQMFSTGPFLLIALSLCNICQGTIVNGFISTSISSLEKRFNLSSIQSGLFSAFYDVAVVAALLPLIHFGKKCHKGRTVATGMLLIGFGSILITLPHFFAGKYTVNAQQENALCDANRTGDICIKNSNSADDNCLWYAIIILSQLFIGIGATPLFTVGISYIDENVLQKDVSLYLGAYMAMSTAGPAMGFIIAGQFLKFWGDLDKSDYTALGISGPNDPRWYGAWWIGFLIFGAFSFLTSIPMFGFPRELPEKEINRSKDIKQTERNLDKDYGEKLISSLKTIRDMLTNIPMLSLLMMQAAEAFLMNGFITFIPKVFESLFGYTSSQAASIAGLIVIPMGLTGSLFGAGVAKFITGYRPTISLTIFFNICTTITALIFMYTHQQLPNTYILSAQQVSLLQTGIIKNMSCNSNCNCGTNYNPVCDVANKISFYSPCYAGCQQNITSENGVDVESWFNCKCIIEPENNKLLPNTPQVIKGLCKNSNSKLLFFVLFALLCFFTFCNVSPIENASLRLVSFDSRDAAICLTWFIVRIFGSIPGAIVFGIIIDKSCVLWKEDCGTKQSCLLYEPQRLSKSMFLFAIIIKIAVITLLTVSASSYKPPENKRKPSNVDVVELEKA